MKKMVPVYILLTGILVSCIVFGMLLLRKAEAMRSDLEVMKTAMPTPPPYPRPPGTPLDVRVVEIVR